jgi:RNA polymerase sigma-32 factor
MTELEQAFENASKTAYHLWLIFGDTVDVRDLRQEGYLAVLEAQKRYSNKEEASLKTFVNKRVRGAMLDYVNRNLRITNTNKSSIWYKLKGNVPRLKEEYNKIKNNNLGDIPDTFEEYFEQESGIAIKYLEQYDEWMLPEDSLDHILYYDEDNRTVNLLDHLGDNTWRPDLYMEHKEEIITLHKVLEIFRKDCSPIEIDILDNRILSNEPLSQEQIAERHSTYKMKVSRIELKLKEKVRTAYEQMYTLDES